MVTLGILVALFRVVVGRMFGRKWCRYFDTKKEGADQHMLIHSPEGLNALLGTVHAVVAGGILDTSIRIHDRM